MASLNFTRHIVALVDVLGFKQRIMNMGRNEENSFLKLYTGDIPQKIKAIKRTKGESGITLNIDIISDTFLFSIECEEENQTGDVLAHICVAVGKLQAYLACDGIWTRGAITIGKLYRNDTNIVGPALIQAYHLEKNDAINPRVILDTRMLSSFDNKIEKLSKDINSVSFSNWRGNKIFYKHNGTVTGNIQDPHRHQAFMDDLPFVDYYNGFEDKERTLEKAKQKLKEGMSEEPHIYKKHMWTKKYFYHVKERHLV